MAIKEVIKCPQCANQFPICQILLSIHLETDAEVLRWHIWGLEDWSLPSFGRPINPTLRRRPWDGRYLQNWSLWHGVALSSSGVGSNRLSQSGSPGLSSLGVPGVPWYLQILADQISTKGGRLCPPNNTGTPGFSDLPTALKPTTRLNHKQKRYVMYLLRYTKVCIGIIEVSFIHATPNHTIFRI